MKSKSIVVPMQDVDGCFDLEISKDEFMGNVKFSFPKGKTFFQMPDSALKEILQSLSGRKKNGK